MYAGFDVTRHTSRLGSSPSLQISKSALLRAGEMGVAAHERRREEIAIAVRPDLIGGYIERLELMHHKASVDQQIAELQHYNGPPEDIDVQSDAAAQRATSFLSEGRRPYRGDPNEVKQRRTILERLETLERHVGIAAGVPAEIGHNNPPEPIGSDTPTAQSQAITAASQEIAAQISKAAPDVAQVATQTTVLAKIASGLRAAKASLGELGKKVKTKAQEKIAEALVGAGLMVGGTLYSTLSSDLNAALHSLATWLRMLF